MIILWTTELFLDIDLVNRTTFLNSLISSSCLCLNFICRLIIVPKFIFSLDLMKCVRLQKCNGSVPCKWECVAFRLFCLYFSFNEMLILLLLWNLEILSYHYVNSWIYRQFPESNSLRGRNCCLFFIVVWDSKSPFKLYILEENQVPWWWFGEDEGECMVKTLGFEALAWTAVWFTDIRKSEEAVNLGFSIQLGHVRF